MVVISQIIAACAEPIARKLSNIVLDPEFIPAWKRSIYIKQQTASHDHACTPEQNMKEENTNELTYGNSCSSCFCGRQITAR